MPLPDLFTENFTVGGVLIQVRDLLAVVVSLAMLAAFTLLLNRTVLGHRAARRRRQLPHDPHAGRAGQPRDRVAFAISGLLAGMVALFWLGPHRVGDPRDRARAPDRRLRRDRGRRAQQPQGAVVGGYVLALMTVGINTFLPQDLVDYRQAFTFGLVILILLFRPEGLIRAR